MFEANKETLTSFIPSSIAKYIHIMYHDPFYHCDKSYKYYGEYALTKDISDEMIDIDRSRLNIEDQVILNQFLDRMKDENYVHDNDEFTKSYIEKKVI